MARYHQEIGLFCSPVSIGKRNRGDRLTLKNIRASDRAVRFRISNPARRVRLPRSTLTSVVPATADGQTEVIRLDEEPVLKTGGRFGDL